MPTPTASDLADLHTRAWNVVAGPGDWLTGPERVAVAMEVRTALECDVCTVRAAALSPSAVSGGHAGRPPLGATAVDTVHRVAVDAKRLTRAWAEGVMAEIGEEVYVELIGLVASVTMLDMYRRAMGEPLDEIPIPNGGEPLGIRPGDVGDVGAWVSQAIERRGANVSRALSLVPATEDLFVTIESWQYSAGFRDLVWTDRALTRPQTELVATTVSSINECFY